MKIGLWCLKNETERRVVAENVEKVWMVGLKCLALMRSDIVREMGDLFRSENLSSVRPEHVYEVTDVWISYVQAIRSQVFDWSCRHHWHLREAC